jgi:SAM-dependent methyltransferase
MQRHLEPEIVNEKNQVLAFHHGSRDYGIKGFLDFYKKYVNLEKGKVVDLGCGTGSYLFALEMQYPELSITGYDASEYMIEIGQNIAENINSGVRLRCEYFKNIKDSADCVISTNTLHHIHDSKIFWNCVKNISNNVFIMDLVRPKNKDIAKKIIDQLAKEDSELFKNDYYNSLLAAFDYDELQQQILGTNFNLVIEGDPNFLQVAIIYGKV